MKPSAVWIAIVLLALGVCGILGAAICLTLLADVQAWADDTLVWSALAVFIGLAMLVGAGLNRGGRAGREDSRSPIGGGAS